MKTQNMIPDAQDAGFSLLEMIAAICLIALAVSIVMPRLGGSRQALTLRATAVELASSLKIARAAARSSNADTVLVIDTAKRSYAAHGAVKAKAM